MTGARRDWSNDMRWATAADYDRLGEVMYDAIRNGRSLYTEAHRAAWMPRAYRGEKWHVRLAAQKVLLAKDGPEIAGFLSLTSDGYIDLAFIRPQSQGKGLFRALYQTQEADAQTLPRLWTHASLMAQPAFAAVGFGVVKHEMVYISGLAFERAEMAKPRLSEF
ncbi:MAG: putative acetyltransferase [Pseudorhodobacter sp.]|jgi:putative acetyltransferase